jgi:hypothetical protein
LRAQGTVRRKVAWDRGTEAMAVKDVIPAGKEKPTGVFDTGAGFCDTCVTVAPMVLMIVTGERGAAVEVVVVTAIVVVVSPDEVSSLVVVGAGVVVAWVVVGAAVVEGAEVTCSVVVEGAEATSSVVVGAKVVVEAKVVVGGV